MTGVWLNGHGGNRTHYTGAECDEIQADDAHVLLKCLNIDEQTWQLVITTFDDRGDAYFLQFNFNYRPDEVPQ